jgi:hypothetical protein
MEPIHAEEPINPLPVPALPATGAPVPPSSLEQLLAVVRATVPGDASTLHLPVLVLPASIESGSAHVRQLLEQALSDALRRLRSRGKATAKRAASPVALMALAAAEGEGDAAVEAEAAAVAGAEAEAGGAAEASPAVRWPKTTGMKLWCTVESLLDPEGATGLSVSEIIKRLNTLASSEGATVNVGSLRNVLSQHREAFTRIAPGTWALLKHVSPAEFGIRQARPRKTRTKATTASGDAVAPADKAEEAVETEEPVAEVEMAEDEAEEAAF